MSDYEIYVASLSDYNNGTLHGVWIDALEDVEYIQVAVTQMLAASPTAAKTGLPAEEWAIHDRTGFPQGVISESSSFEDVAAAATFLSEHGAAGEAWLANLGMPSDWNEAEDAFLDAYMGTYESLGDYAREVNEGRFSIPDALERFIDWEAMGKEDVLGGGIWTHESGWKQVHVFSNH